MNASTKNTPMEDGTWRIRIMHDGVWQENVADVFVSSKGRVMGRALKMIEKAEKAYAKANPNAITATVVLDDVTYTKHEDKTWRTAGVRVAGGDLACDLDEMRQAANRAAAGF